MSGRGRGRGRISGSRRYPKFEFQTHRVLKERPKDHLFAQYTVYSKPNSSRYYSEDEIINYLEDGDYAKQVIYDLCSRIDDALAYAFVNWPTSPKVRNEEVYRLLVQHAPKILPLFYDSHDSDKIGCCVALTVRCNAILPRKVGLSLHTYYYHREEPILNELIAESFLKSEELLTNEDVERIIQTFGYKHSFPVYIDGLLYQISRVRQISCYQRAIGILSEFILQQLRAKNVDAFRSLELLVNYFYVDMKRKPMYDAHKRVRRAVRVLYTHLTDGKTSPEIRDLSKKTLVKLTEMGVSLSILKDKKQYALVELLSIGMKQAIQRAQQRQSFTDLEIVTNK